MTLKIKILLGHETRGRAAKNNGVEEFVYGLGEEESIFCSKGGRKEHKFEGEDMVGVW